MVFVWSALTKGDPAYTVVQVATNDLIILVAFVPIVKFLLGVSNVSVPWDTLILSVVLFVVIPLAGGMLTRYFVTRKKGAEYFESTFVKKFDGITTIGLLLTLVLIFAFQGCSYWRTGFGLPVPPRWPECPCSWHKHPWNPTACA